MANQENEIKEMYEEIKNRLSDERIDLLRRYFEAANNFYKIIPLKRLLRIIKEALIKSGAQIARSDFKFGTTNNISHNCAVNILYQTCRLYKLSAGGMVCRSAPLSLRDTSPTRGRPRPSNEICAIWRKRCKQDACQAAGLDLFSASLVSHNMVVICYGICEFLCETRRGDFVLISVSPGYIRRCII